MMANIPTLETGRLRLRAHRTEDLDACAAMWGDATVTKYIGGRPFSREDVWARLLRYAGHWQWLNYGFWLMEERETGRFAGEIGLADFKRELDPPVQSGPEAGWVLPSEARGKGFATEALLAVTNWHDARAAAEPVQCIIHPDNAASIRVAQKCGFTHALRARYKGDFAELYVRR